MERPRLATALWPMLAAWVALSVLFLALLWTAAFGATGTVVLDDYASAVAPAVTGLACLRAWRRDGGQTGRAWMLLGLSQLCWAAGGVTWTIYEVHLGRAIPFPSFADVGYLVSVPLAVAALLSFPGTRLTGAARLRPLLDATIAAGALLFVSWTAVLGPVFYAGSGSWLLQALALAYPVSDVLTATIALLTLARARGPQRITMSLVGAGLLIVAVADSSFAWFAAHGAYTTGNLFDTGYIAGFLLIGVAALRAGDTASNPGHVTDAAAGRDAVTVAPSRLAIGLPYAPLLISLPMLVALQVSGRHLSSFQLYLTVVLMVAVLLRQLLSMQVIVGLSGQLHDTVAALRRQEQELHDTVAQLRHREVQLHFQAFHDPLTGLANRALFADRISHALARTRHPAPVFLLLADLDDFKSVNDTLGHPAGDALLVAVAERLRAVVRPEDTVARLGGDEFAVLLEATDGLADARGVAERIAQALVHPFRLSGVNTVIGASIGIAAAGPTPSGDAMLRDADIAMYAAKANGKGGYTVYAVELAAANRGQQQLTNDLNQALSGGELAVKYQPIVDLTTGRLIGVEALLRWNHPTKGAIPPATFIPLAEASGAILPIGRWVLARACAQVRHWPAPSAGAAPLQLSVNVSGRQLTDPQLLPAVRAALTAGGLQPHQLTLEITENVLIDDDTAMAPLVALRGLGVRPGHRRLRDRPLLVQPPAPLPHHHPQDRSELHRRPLAGRQGTGRRCRRDPRPRPWPRPADHCRRGRDRASARGAACAGLHPGTGLPVRPTRRRRCHRRPHARRDHPHRPGPAPARRQRPAVVRFGSIRAGAHAGMSGGAVHEMSVTHSVVCAVQERLPNARVVRVRLEIGRLSGVVADSVRFCFEVVTAGTGLEGAALEIVEPAGRGRCRGCGAMIELPDLIMLCGCGSADVEVTAGTELLIKEVEVG